ncbi:DUF4136 domain-containing protein [Sphingomonas immobilis]|uniref:DUF4136 domain-containing protein n=1 Tax=Sphingomonas immobilis TaxID=3063997 RepID=A0ABT8ZXN9_9SPHN|nr:hypothetical protein [Sphingomonas sp. CA1-15]MDO7842341.1 hypothetical protein [Sphingomonas sp. CA1-15]
MTALALPAAAEPMRPGTVSVVLTTPGGSAEAERPVIDAVQQALSDAAFVVMPTAGHSRYIAQIAVAQEDRGSVTARTVPGKATGSVGGWGAQGSVTLPSSKRALRDLVMTELKVTLVTRANGKAVWSGRATTAQVEGTRQGDPAAVFGKLATAVLSRFPGAATGLISVP